jgi:hypothetical protein
LEGSWGTVDGHILTECYAGGRENNTLIMTSPNHVEFLDNHGDRIHLMRGDGTALKTNIPSSESELELEHQAHTAYDNERYFQAISLFKQALQLDSNAKNPRLLTNVRNEEGLKR